jgi:hypothetical protein
MISLTLDKPGMGAGRRMDDGSGEYQGCLTFAFK